MKIYFLILSCIFSTSVSLQENKDVILWDQSRKLTWNDYKANPEPGNDDAAATTTYLGIEYNITSSSFSYRIQSRFSKTRSWGRYKDDYVLSHEQGHFDIAEILENLELYCSTNL